ncbi:putative CBL-interacting protein kinase 13 [Hordeum vulgare]|nr:putative CBL-interacting protein kinase 13 [Hordeum vulgare]
MTLATSGTCMKMRRSEARETVVNAEEKFKILKEKENMGKGLRFFKVNFAKMVADKEHALEQLDTTQNALTHLKEELEKKKICDRSATNVHQVVRAKEEKERDLMKKERDPMKQEMDKLM